MSTSKKMTSPKKLKGRNRHTTIITTTTNDEVHDESLKVSNTKKLSNIQVSNTCYMYEMYSTILNE